MTISSEIRASLSSGAPTTVDAIFDACASCRDRPKLISNLYALKAEGKIKRAGLSEDGDPQYQLAKWPVGAVADPVPDEEEAPAAIETPKFLGRPKGRFPGVNIDGDGASGIRITPANNQHAQAVVSSDWVILERLDSRDWVVARMPDGRVMVANSAGAGAVYFLPAEIVRAICRMGATT